MPPLAVSDIGSVVLRHVQSVEAIDVHTHLLPPSHGALLLWGVDELLTYHYLVAELFMVLPTAEPETDSVTLGGAAPPDPTPEVFFGWSKAVQAELVFEELFVKRTPLSEACRGVITALNALGLGEQLLAAKSTTACAPRLAALRAWFKARPLADHVEQVFAQAKIRYAVMTNIPFVPEEIIHWLPSDSGAPPPSITPRLRPALRVDPLLSGDWKVITATMRAATPLARTRGGGGGGGGDRGGGYPETLDGCRAFLRDWAERMKPVYLMASTPAGFKYTPSASRKRKHSEALDSAADVQPYSDAAGPGASALIERVLLPLALELNLPLALKVGAVRGANPALRAGGDAVEVADLSFVRALCASYPSVKILLTVLSDVNQHELCVLSRKFGNVHVYGCWWFCNVPSLIEKTTRMRLEMLGTAFTCQHSDCRVLEQLLYKWPHSREAVAPVLAEMYERLSRAGWEVSEADVERDVKLLFGGAYEAFLAK